MTTLSRLAAGASPPARGSGAGAWESCPGRGSGCIMNQKGSCLGRERRASSWVRRPMPAFFFPRRLLSIGGISRTLLLACVAAILGIVGGRVAISHYGTPAIELLIAVPLLILLTSRPFPACIVLLGLLGSMFAYGDLPRANLPGPPPLPAAAALMGAGVVGSRILRKPWRRWPRPVRSYALVLLLLLALASVSTIRLALLGHDPARSA